MPLTKVTYAETYSSSDYSSEVVLNGEHAHWYYYDEITGLVTFDRIFAIPLNLIRSIESDAPLTGTTSRLTDVTDVSTLTFSQ